MENKRFKPLFDKVYLSICISTALLMLAATVFCFLEPVALAIMIPADIFVLYFLLSPTVGYVELREDSVFIKFGFIMEREISYGKIRGITKERKFYADSMLSLKNAMEHINIKYNRFDIVSVSVVNGEELAEEICRRMSK